MKSNNSERFIKILAYVTVTIVSILCFLPFWLIIIGSFTAESEVLRHGFSVWPKSFSIEAYKLVFQIPERIFRAYGITIFITAFGGGLSLFLTTMAAFVLMRKDFKYRDQIAMFFYFPTIFSGGLLPTYLLISNYLQLKDTIWSLIFPGLLGAWNIFLMRNFMRDIPDSIMESAKLDGANDFKIFLRLYLPLCKAGLATIGLFIALGYWNNWANARLYINKPDLYPLQYLLYQMFASIQAIRDAAQKIGLMTTEMPSETFRMAMSVVTTGPILFLYPFVQRYFVKGITIGAVKG
jgi:putative aldouronate transport system permease protein